MPTPNELASLLRQGMGDALLSVLRQEYRDAVQAELVPVEAAFAAASVRRHQEVEAAKAQLRGTDDAMVVEPRTEEGRRRKQEVLARKNKPDASALWVTDASAAREVYYRIDLQRFGEVAEFEREAHRHDLLRRALAHEHVAKVLATRGVEALDADALRQDAERSQPVGRRKPQ